MADNKRDSEGIVHGLSTPDGSQEVDPAVGGPVGVSVEREAEEESPQKADLQGRQPQVPCPSVTPDPPKADPELGDLPSGDVDPSDVLDAKRASVEASRQRSNANLRPGNAESAARARAAKRQRESGVMTRDELAVTLSNKLRDKSLPAHAMASLARVLADIQGYSKGPPPVDPSKPTADLQALIRELQPEDFEDKQPEPEPEVGDPPFAKPESSNNSTLTAEENSENSGKNSEKDSSDGND